ncbi:unnamed protein product [Mytilus edulis]|uniref:Reverse transcriptase RNase H-like domain-containing protein n=1 Tax=Mytilus edulis TaxID=6550 RepID=A0A8S3TYY1_MYTED|nr:unnamed protein product [Mytilus edulis]
MFCVCRLPAVLYDEEYQYDIDENQNESDCYDETCDEVQTGNEKRDEPPGDTIVECSLNIQDTVKLVSDLGFILHEKKSVLIPTKKIQFLGFLIDSEKMIVTLTQDKKELIHKESHTLLSRQNSKIGEVASYIGLIISSFSAVDYGQLYYRDIETEKIHALKMAKGNFYVNMEITDKMKKEILWWSCNIYTQSRVLDRVNPQIILQTDASLSGWVAVLIDIKTGSRWTPDEQKYHINYLELLAILYVLKSFESQLKCFTHVKILTDNTTAVSYVNKMGGIKSICCNTIAKSIWFWAKKQNVWLTASHIAGTENTIADAESRKFNDQVEWQLNKDIFCDICELQMCTEDLERQDNSYFSSAVMADSSMVYSGDADVNRYTHTDYGKERSTDSSFMPVPKVTLKIVMLIALTNATRVQTLKFLSVDCMEKLREEFVFHLDVLLKQSRPGYKNPDVKLRAFPPDRRLCVYTVLKEYIKRTELLRVHTNQLLISYIKPHKAVTCSTISRWIKVVFQKSGIDTRQFSAHSVRSAATSKAKLYNVSLADIMSKAGWTNVNTFATFYNKRIINSTSFDVNVLNN